MATSEIQDDLDAEQPIELREYLRVLSAHKWLILATTILVLGSVILFSLNQTPLYRADARLFVEPVAVGSDTGVIAPPNLQTQSELVRSVPVAELVRDDLDLGLASQDLLEDVVVSVTSESEVLTVSYVARDRETAALVANSFAENYLEYRRSTASARLQAAADVISGRIDSVQRQLATVSNELEALDPEEDPEAAEVLEAQQASLLARLGVLQQELDDLQPAQNIQLSGGEVIEAAEEPTTPASPNHLTNGFLGGLLGLVIGIGFAFFRDRLDNRLRERGDVERELAIPVLISIPRFQTSKDEALLALPLLGDPTSSASEAYRGLRTNVQFLATQRGFKSLLITSPDSGEGKTMTAANLGISLAQAGQKVILVSADLRRPTLDRHFGIAEDKKGLTDWLGGDDRSPVDSIADPGIAQLRIVPSGGVASNPAEILTSPRFVELLRFLEENADWVLVDSPPVLPVADATILASRVGGIILVVNAKTTSRAAAKYAKTELERVGGRILGAALNVLEESSGRYAYYSRGYASRSEDGKKPRRKGRRRRKEQAAVD